MNSGKNDQSLLKHLENKEKTWYHMYSFIMAENFSTGSFLTRKENKMSKEAIERIRDAEERARAIVAEAEKNAALMISSAEKNAADLRAETERSTGEELKRTLDAMRKKSDELIEKSISEAKAESDELLSKADMKTLSAVKKIVWEIIEV